MWTAINTLTKGHSPVNNNLLSELKPDVFNAHFVSVVSKFLPDDQTDGFQYSCPDKLWNCCCDRTSKFLQDDETKGSEYSCPDKLWNVCCDRTSECLPDDQTEGFQYSCPDRLLNFCSSRTSHNATFSIPPISVFETGIYISKMDNKKSTGCDGISVKFLKIALPCHYSWNTYIYL